MLNVFRFANFQFKTTLCLFYEIHHIHISTLTYNDIERISQLYNDKKYNRYYKSQKTHIQLK